MNSTVDDRAPAAPPLRVEDLGLVSYTPLWHAMQRYTDQRHGDSSDYLLLLQHEPVYTLGQAGKPEHILCPGEIPVVQSDRGGQVTYHGPGQLVVYPLLDLQRLQLGVRELVTRLETAIINTLAEFDVHGHRREGMPGVYVADSKIAALGLRIRKACSYHGLAFNVAMDTEPFSRINPCGYANLEVTDLQRCCGSRCPSMQAVQATLLGMLLQDLGLGVAAEATQSDHGNVFSKSIIDYSRANAKPSLA